MDGLRVAHTIFLFGKILREERDVFQLPRVGCMFQDLLDAKVCATNCACLSLLYVSHP